MSVVNPPAQIVGLDAVAVTVGVGVTVTVTTAVFEQPGPTVPVTVYVVVLAGETLTEDPFRLPGIQLYVLAPPAVSVVELPEQIGLMDAEAVTVGAGPTVTVTGSRHQPAHVPTQ